MRGHGVSFVKKHYPWSDLTNNNTWLLI